MEREIRNCEINLIINYCIQIEIIHSNDFLQNKGIEMGSEQLQTGTIQATDDASEHMRMIQQKLTQSEKQLADMQEKNAIKFVGWGRRVAELAASEKELNAVRFKTLLDYKTSSKLEHLILRK